MCLVVGRVVERGRQRGVVWWQVVLTSTQLRTYTTATCLLDRTVNLFCVVVGFMGLHYTRNVNSTRKRCSNASYVLMYVRTYLCKHAHTYVRTYVRTYVSMHACTYVRTYVRMYMRMRVCNL